MNVELAEERILLLPDKLGAQMAEGRAWSKRTDAFGAFAKLGGFLQKPKDEDYEVVYRELRLQPFWRLSVSTTHIYERQRQHKHERRHGHLRYVVEGVFPGASHISSFIRRTLTVASLQRRLRATQTVYQRPEHDL